MAFVIRFLASFFGKYFARFAVFLGGFLAPLVAPVMTWIASFFRKTGILLMVIAAVFAAIGVFSAAIGLLISSITPNLPSELFTFGRMFLPSNLQFCISVLVVAKVKSLIFYWVSKFSEKLIHT